MAEDPMQKYCQLDQTLQPQCWLWADCPQEQRLPLYSPRARDTASPRRSRSSERRHSRTGSACRSGAEERRTPMEHDAISLTSFPLPRSPAPQPPRARWPQSHAPTRTWQSPAPRDRATNGFSARGLNCHGTSFVSSPNVREQQLNRAR